MKKNYSKDTLWLSIETNNMLRDSMKSFFDFLKKFNVDYITYNNQSSSDLIYMKLLLTNEIVFDANHEFYKGLGEFVYFLPVNMLVNKPKVSDYDIIEDMSIAPYDIDKWRN